MKLLRRMHFYIITHRFKEKNIINDDPFQDAIVLYENKSLFFYLYFLFITIQSFLRLFNGLLKPWQCNRFYQVINYV